MSSGGMPSALSLMASTAIPPRPNTNDRAEHRIVGKAEIEFQASGSRIGHGLDNHTIDARLAHGAHLSISASKASRT
jgi:hypothetical protein